MESKRTCFEFLPMESPSLPGFPIDANICRNPACLNFGISERNIETPKYGYRLTEVDGSVRHECKRCKQKQIVYSNTSILEAFHRCLAMSIPYASCPNRACSNHYKNLFEYYSGNLKDKPYLIHDKRKSICYYQARCRECSKTFTLSEPLRLHTSNREDWLMEIDRFINGIVDGQGASNIMNQMQVPADRYYSQLKAAANALLDYNKFQIIKLMQLPHKGQKLRIYTDCIVCSIKANRKDQRHEKIKIIVSSCVCDGRALILAFHPLFDLLRNKDKKWLSDNDLIEDNNRPLEHRKYQYLKHPFNRKEGDPLPLLGLDGYSMDEYYAYMGHFLVLRKLLAKVSSLAFYMDAEVALYNAALASFADRIEEYTCDVVLVKVEKNGEKSKTQDSIKDKYTKEIEKAKRAYKAVNTDSKQAHIKELREFLLSEEMKIVNESIQGTSRKKAGELFPESLSNIYKKATKRANSAGKPYWIHDSLSGEYTPNTKMLWLTRTVNRSNTQHELDLYINGNLFYIDSFFSALRYRSASIARPLSSATGHKNYTRSPTLPATLIRDFTINVGFWNNSQKYRNRNKPTIAFVHGLAKKPGSPSIKELFKSRCTFNTAKRISPWLGI